MEEGKGKESGGDVQFGRRVRGLFSNVQITVELQIQNLQNLIVLRDKFVFVVFYYTSKLRLSLTESNSYKILSILFFHMKSDPYQSLRYLQKINHKIFHYIKYDQNYNEDRQE